MNIVESLRKIENQLFYKTGEAHNLVGAYLAEDVDKEKVWEMLKSNNVKGIINLLEQAWYDDEWDDRDFATVDKPRNKREQMEYIEKYCDMVDGELVSVNGKPKIVYPDGELVAGSLSELVDMIHKELNEDYEPEWHDTADQEQLDQPDYTPECVDDDIDCEWWCGLDEKLSEKEMDKYKDLESEYNKLPNQWGGKAKAIMKMMAKLANKMDDDQMRKFVSNKMAMAESLEDLNVLTDDELEQYRSTDPDRDRDYAGTMLWEDVNYVEDLFPEISTEDADIISDYVEHLDAHLYLTDDGVIIVQPLAFDSFGYKDLKSFLKDVRYTVNQWDDENFDIDESINDLGTLTPSQLAKIESRRDALWHKEDAGTITDKEQKELDELTKQIEGHYSKKKELMAKNESLNEDINETDVTKIVKEIYDKFKARPEIGKYMLDWDCGAKYMKTVFDPKIFVKKRNGYNEYDFNIFHIEYYYNNNSFNAKCVNSFSKHTTTEIPTKISNRMKAFMRPIISDINSELSDGIYVDIDSRYNNDVWSAWIIVYIPRTLIEVNESLNESDDKRFNSSREVMEFFYELASMSDNPEDAIKKFVDEHKSDPHVEDAYDEWCDMEPY